MPPGFRHGCADQAAIGFCLRILASGVARTDRTFFFDMPLLPERDRGNDQQRDLDRDQEDHEQTDQVTGQRSFGESGLVAGEPRGSTDRAKNRQQHRKRESQGERPTTPAPDHHRQQDVNGDKDQGDDSDQLEPPTRTAHPPATIDKHENGGDDQQHHREKPRGERLGFLPVRPPKLVAGPCLSNRHGPIIETNADARPSDGIRESDAPPRIIRGCPRNASTSRADVAELVDASGLGPGTRKGVEVRVLSSALEFQIGPVLAPVPAGK